MNEKKTDSAFMRHILAVNLRKIRKTQRLSQERLAELANISKNEIGRIENEQTSAGLDILTVLAVGLGMEVMQLLDPKMNPMAAFLSSDKEDQP